MLAARHNLAPKAKRARQAPRPHRPRSAGTSSASIATTSGCPNRSNRGFGPAKSALCVSSTPLKARLRTDSAMTPRSPRDCWARSARTARALKILPPCSAWLPFKRSAMVIWSPSGTPATYFETGSSRSSRPSWASCTITAAVIVLVFEAIRKWVSARGGIVVPSCRGAVGDRELALGGGQDDHGTGNQQLLGCRVHGRLERGLV